MTTYGYIGLGQMGLAMTTRLCATEDGVFVFDLDEERVREATELGATAAASAADVAREADIVSICVPAASHVEAVLTGPGGVQDAARPQTILIHSTISPEDITRFAAIAQRWGATLHDASVAGGSDAARSGELVILAGGLRTMVPEAAELLSTYGSKVIDAGPIGAGASLKLGINVMTYAQFAAASTAFDIVSHAGGSTDDLVAAWKHIGQLGKLTESFLVVCSLPPEHITGSFRDGLANTVEIARKDLELAASLCDAQSTRRRTLEDLGASMPEVFGIERPEATQSP